MLIGSVGMVIDLDWHLDVEFNFTVNVMDTVRWTWADSDNHTVTGLNGSFDSGPPTSAPFVFEHVFDTKGQFDYLCSVHPFDMVGSITVIPGMHCLRSTVLYLQTVIHLIFRWRLVRW